MTSFCNVLNVVNDFFHKKILTYLWFSRIEKCKKCEIKCLTLETVTLNRLGKPNGRKI